MPEDLTLSGLAVAIGLVWACLRALDWLIKLYIEPRVSGFSGEPSRVERCRFDAETAAIHRETAKILRDLASIIREQRAIDIQRDQRTHDKLDNIRRAVEAKR